MINHQRIDSISNAHAGKEFELLAQNYFESEGLTLEREYAIQIGINERSKSHNFDLGSSISKTLVECKSHRWTSSDKVPSAKMTVWNEAMFYFLASPIEYRKILFVLKDFSLKRNETLAEYYIRTHGHLVPRDVEIWEYDEKTKTASNLHIGT